MKQFIEIVPNFSEGRNKQIIDEITDVIADINDAWLLDVEMDADHNRTVVTVIVTPETLVEAGKAMLTKAVELIDLNNHTGQHPRMGACDVFPLIPLSGVTIDQAKALSVQLAEELANSLDLPTYLYEEAALKPWRKNLARVRKSGPLVEGGEKVPAFEWLRENIKNELELRKPDFGPENVHPTAGITAISTRFFLVAYNINLETTDLSVAEHIALKIRERSGGFPAVKALGFELKEQNCVQVSMNLVDYRKTGIDTVFTAIQNLAADKGVKVRESELIGLVPQNAIDTTALGFLGVDDIENAITQESGSLPALAYPVDKLKKETQKFSSTKVQFYQVFSFDNIEVLTDFAKIQGLKNAVVKKPISQDILNEFFKRMIMLPKLDENQIIENNVKNVTGATIPTMVPNNPHKMLKPYLEITASEAPTPGGGSISALAGSFSAALGEMVANLTRSKKKYFDNWAAASDIVDKLNVLQEEAYDLILEDSKAYNLVSAAMKLPKKTEEDLKIRAAEYQIALKKAIQTPQRTSKVAVEIAEKLVKLLTVGLPAAITDIGVAAMFAKTAFEGAIFNVRINLLDLEDAELKADILKQIAADKAIINDCVETILTKVESELSPE